MDIGRIIHPLRLAKGSHQPESGKGSAMNGKFLIGVAGAVFPSAWPAGRRQPGTATSGRPGLLAAERRRASPERIRRCWKTATAGPEMLIRHIHGNADSRPPGARPSKLTSDQGDIRPGRSYDLCPVPVGTMTNRGI